MDSPAVGPGMVIEFHYDLYDEQSEIIESSRAGQPLLILHGERTVLPALQAAFNGRTAGEEFSVPLSHEKAYGRRYPERQQRLPIKRIDRTGKARLQPGQRVNINGPKGSQQGSIVKVGRFNVDVDMNHPLAGRDLRFEISVLSVREATDDELAHGHAHGPAHDPEHDPKGHQRG